MKKFFVYSLCVMLAFGLQSCRAKTVVESEESASAAEASGQAVEGGVRHINTEQFLKQVYDYKTNPKEFIYEGSLPCIVDFYATWCGPCKRLAPILDELAREYAGKVVIYKVDVDQEKELSAAFGIQSIPTLLFVPMRGTPAIQAGLMSKEQLKEAIDSFLLSPQE